MTWSKLIWSVALNIIAGIAAALTIAFNVLYAVNPYICIVASGCNYLWYTYSASGPFYTGEIILGIALLISGYFFFWLLFNLIILFYSFYFCDDFYQIWCRWFNGV